MRSTCGLYFNLSCGFETHLGYDFSGFIALYVHTVPTGSISIAFAQIAGPKSTTVPQSGLDTKARASPLAQLMLQQVVDGKADPKSLYLYNPTSMADSSGRFFNVTENWLMPPVPTTINGREDAFSQRCGFQCTSRLNKVSYLAPFSRLGAECAESNYPSVPPEQALFDPKQVVIVSNGR